MDLITPLPQAENERARQVQKAKSLAALLREEFACPFAIYDAANGDLISNEPFHSDATPPTGLFQLGHLVDLAGEGKVCVHPASEGQYRMLLVVHASNGPAFIAVATIPALASVDADRSLEQARLVRWGQAVADRLRLTDDLAGKAADDSQKPNDQVAPPNLLPALDGLIRSLRIHQEPAQHKERILEAALKAGLFQTLVWVPLQARASAVLKGKECLTQPDCHRLLHALTSEADFHSGAPLVCNAAVATTWGRAFPRVANLLAMPVSDPGPVGWVLAINKQDTNGAEGKSPADSTKDSPKAAALIGPVDIERLSPFVGLLELHLRSFARYGDVKELLVGLTKSLTAALDAKDSYTYGHSERVARITVELGRELGFSPDDLSELYLMGLLHDVGNLGVKESILSKPEKLTPEEFDHIKQHVTIGYSILSDLGPVRHLLPGILYHHENYDGSGYPDGLVGEAIPLVARILAVAEACDSMSNKRPYRDALPYRLVEETLVEGSGKQWDPQVVQALLRCRHRIHTIRQRGVGHSLHVAIDNALGVGPTVLHGSPDSSAGHTAVK
jgi:HD-GYP domain-containing protein (c-di-GMP phosphodiesterase class II)